MSATDSISYEGLVGLYENSLKALDKANDRVASAEETVRSAEAIREASFEEAEKWSALLDERELAAS